MILKVITTIASYLVRRSAPNEASDRLWRAIAASLSEVSNATPYLHSKELGGQEHGSTKPVEAPALGARGPGSEAVYGETCIG